MISVYEMTLPPRTMEDADAKVSAVLENAKARVGAVPNMYNVMANSPGLLETYLDGYARFRQDSWLHSDRAGSRAPYDQP